MTAVTLPASFFSGYPRLRVALLDTLPMPYSLDDNLPVASAFLKCRLSETERTSFIGRAEAQTRPDGSAMYMFVYWGLSFNISAKMVRASKGLWVVTSGNCDKAMNSCRVEAIRFFCSLTIVPANSCVSILASWVAALLC